MRKHVKPVFTKNICLFFPTRKEDFSKIEKYFMIFPPFFSEANWWSIFFNVYSVLHWGRTATLKREICLMNAFVYLFQQEKKSSESRKRILYPFYFLKRIEGVFFFLNQKFYYIDIKMLHQYLSFRQSCWNCCFKNQFVKKNLFCEAFSSSPFRPSLI